MPSRPPRNPGGSSRWPPRAPRDSVTTSSSSSMRAGRRYSISMRRTMNISPCSPASSACGAPGLAHRLGARALGEGEIAGVIDDAAGIGVLVIDAAAIAVHRGRPAQSSSAQQVELRDRGLGRGQAEMAPARLAQHPAAAGAQDQPLLDQERLDHVFERVARLGQRGGQRLDARPARRHGARRCGADSAGPSHRARAGPPRAAAAPHRRSRGPPGACRRPRRNRAPGAAAARRRAACRASAARSPPRPRA